METLDYFIGHWDIRAEDPSSRRTFTLRYEIEPAMGGVWLAGHATAAEPQMEIHDFWGKDPVTGEIVRAVFDSQNNFGIVRSKGWEGDILIFEGDVNGAAGIVQVRETITRADARSFTAAWEMKMGEEWVTYSLETATLRYH